MNASKGEKSIPETGGNNLRSGASMGCVRSAAILMIGLYPCGENQLIMTTINSAKIKICMLERNTSTTANNSSIRNDSGTEARTRIRYIFSAATAVTQIITLTSMDPMLPSIFRTGMTTGLVAVITN